MYLVDSHCHLNLLDLTPENDLNAVMARAKAEGVSYILNVCVSLADFPALLKTAEAYTWVGASVGLHPNDHTEEVDEERLFELASHEKVIAIGETGLDYFRSTGDTEWQRDRFRTHIAVSKKIRKPLIVHTREAKEDTMQILQAEKANEIGGVMHCFTEDWETAKRALDMNFYLSFSGIVTYKSAQVMQEVAKKVPLNRLLIETDAPYLAPNPMRGKPNEPAYLRHTAEYIAQLRNIPFAELAEHSTQNFFHLFHGALAPHV